MVQNADQKVGWSRERGGFADRVRVEVETVEGMAMPGALRFTSETCVSRISLGVGIQQEFKKYKLDLLSLGRC